MTAVGDVAFRRRYWKCTCGLAGSYAVDSLLGIEGERYTKTVQKHCCRLSADNAFASASENMHDMLGVDVSRETVRTMVEGCDLPGAPESRAFSRFLSEKGD